MAPHRIVTNVNVEDASTGHDFHEGFLGLREEFDLGWTASFRSPSNPSVQASLVAGDATAPEQSSTSVAVPDADAAHEDAQRRGYEIVYPRTPEPWGVRRFFVRDPHGIVVNVVRLTDEPQADPRAASRGGRPPRRTRHPRQGERAPDPVHDGRGGQASTTAPDVLGVRGGYTVRDGPPPLPRSSSTSGARPLTE